MSLKHNDLRDLVFDTVSIDQFKSKVGKDYNVVVLGVKVKGKEPAHDLSKFLETGHDVLDVDVSTGPNTDGEYTVYLEMERNSKLYDRISTVLEDIVKADNSIKTWNFTSYQSKEAREFVEENFNDSVITSSYDYMLKYNKDASKIYERIQFLNRY